MIAMIALGIACLALAGVSLIVFYAARGMRALGVTASRRSEAAKKGWSTRRAKR